MSEIALAVAASFCFALTYIFSKLAAGEVSPILGGFIASAVVSLLYLPWMLYSFPVQSFWNPDLLWYVGLGLFIPGVSRTLHFAGVQRIGASPAGLVRGMGPLFATTLAVLLLGEVLTSFVAAGTGFILLGISALLVRKEEMRSWSVAGVFYVLVSTLILVSRDLIIRYASPKTPSKTQAVFIMATTSALVMAVACGWFDRGSITSASKKGLFFFVLLGVANFLALTGLFFALEKGDVVVVTPIISAQPLFVLLLSAMFLRGKEQITPMMIAGAVLIVLGGALIGIG